jgi:hypothetical protein
MWRRPTLMLRNRLLSRRCAQFAERANTLRLAASRGGLHHHLLLPCYFVLLLALCRPSARRFSELQEKMVKSPDATREQIAEWEAEAIAIRRAEPPTMWAVYALCWNQSVERHYEKDGKKHFRQVGWIPYIFRNTIQFRPRDFPAT